MPDESCGQLLKCQYRGRYHMTQGIDKQSRGLPAIEAESHLVQVSGKMLCTDLVPASHDNALEQRKCGFNGVGRNAFSIFVSHVFFLQVIHNLVVNISDRVLVGRVRIGDENVNVSTDVVADILSKGAGFRILSVEESQFTISLTDSNNNFLCCFGCGRASSEHPSAHVGFVHFNGTVKHGLLYFFHGRTDAVAEIPCGFVGTFVLAPNCALELERAHSLLSFTEKQDSHKPDGQWQVRIIEDRARSYRELITAFTTSELLAGVNPPHVSIMAARTVNALWPAQAGENFPAILVGRKHPIQVRECHGRTS